jgi:hypothetical protein
MPTTVSLTLVIGQDSSQHKRAAAIWPAGRTLNQVGRTCLLTGPVVSLGRSIATDQTADRLVGMSLDPTDRRVHDDDGRSGSRCQPDSAVAAADDAVAVATTERRPPYHSASTPTALTTTFHAVTEYRTRPTDRPPASLPPAKLTDQPA